MRLRFSFDPSQRLCSVFPARQVPWPLSPSTPVFFPAPIFSPAPILLLPDTAPTSSLQSTPLPPLPANLDEAPTTLPKIPRW